MRQESIDTRGISDEHKKIIEGLPDAKQLRHLNRMFVRAFRALNGRQLPLVRSIYVNELTGEWVRLANAGRDVSDYQIAFDALLAGARRIDPEFSVEEKKPRPAVKQPAPAPIKAAPAVVLPPAAKPAAPVRMPAANPANQTLPAAKSQAATTTVNISDQVKKYLDAKNFRRLLKLSIALFKPPRRGPTACKAATISVILSLR